MYLSVIIEYNRFISWKINGRSHLKKTVLSLLFGSNFRPVPAQERVPRRPILFQISFGHESFETIN